MVWSTWFFFACGDTMIAGIRVPGPQRSPFGGVTGVHVEIALRLVERHRRQRAGLDGGDEMVARRAAADARIAQVLLPCRRARTKLAEIIERLMMRLEVQHFGE